MSVTVCTCSDSKRNDMGSYCETAISLAVHCMVTSSETTITTSIKVTYWHRSYILNYYSNWHQTKNLIPKIPETLKKLKSNFSPQWKQWLFKESSCIALLKIPIALPFINQHYENHFIELDLHQIVLFLLLIVKTNFKVRHSHPICCTFALNWSL